MSASAMANPRASTVRTGGGVARRVRRCLAMSGWLALLLGGALGFLQTEPALLDGTLGPLGVKPGELPPWLLFPAHIRLLGFALAGMALVGLVSGAIAGLWLQGTSGLLRFLVALLAVLIAVISAEIVRGILLGLPLSVSLRRFNDGLEAAQIGVGALGAMIGVRTGRQRTTTRRLLQNEPRRLNRNRRPAPRLAHVERPRRLVNTIRLPSISSIRLPSISSIRLPSIRVVRLPSTLMRRLSVWIRSANTSSAAGSVRRVRVARPAPSHRRSRAGGRRASGRNVHLGREATSVCPYCLEEVMSDDPHGVVVCEVCGTPHHGDCWAITGKCEVPHLRR